MRLRKWENRVILPTIILNSFYFSVCNTTSKVNSVEMNIFIAFLWLRLLYLISITLLIVSHFLFSFLHIIKCKKFTCFTSSWFSIGVWINRFSSKVMFVLNRSFLTFHNTFRSQSKKRTNFIIHFSYFSV